MEQQVIPDGYKQTEVGVIPDDWGIKQIGEFASVSSGGTPSRDNKNYWDGNIPWITTTLIKGKEINTAEQFITAKGLQNSATKWFKKGTILIAMYGQGKTRGQVAILGMDATINQACAAITINSNDNQSYILHFLNSQYEIIRELSNSGGQENLSGNIVKSILIPLPPKKEQTAIANALSDVDALIASIEKLIAKKQAIKTATMQQLLTGKKRLPPFDKHPDGTPKGTQQTELGEIPEDWEIRELDSVTSFIGSGKTNTNGKGEYPLYGSTGQIGTCVAAEYSGSAILIARVGANAGKLNSVVGAYGVSDNTIIVKINSSSDIEFFKYQLIKANLNSLVFGSGQPLITGSQLKQIVLPIPVLQEQKIISSVLSDMENEIDQLNNRLTKTQQIKQGIMQELLTGKTRLIHNER